MKKLNLQIASDLHLEFLQRRFPGQTLVEPDPLADVLVLAGDIANDCDAIELFADWPVPVVYVMGNHEFYGCNITRVRAEAKKLCAGTSVTVLDNDSVTLEQLVQQPRFAALRERARAHPVRFVGCTLWTDYKLFEPLVPAVMAKAAAERGLNDHRCINQDGVLFSAGHALSEHLRSRAWLADELAKPFDGRTVVVSHHGPHRNSVHPRYADSVVSAAFVSELPELLDSADLWVHGHVHDSFDYTVGSCRVVANPAGYVRNRHTADRMADLQLENAQWGRGVVSL